MCICVNVCVYVCMANTRPTVLLFTLLTTPAVLQILFTLSALFTEARVGKAPNSEDGRRLEEP